MGGAPLLDKKALTVDMCHFVAYLLNRKDAGAGRLRSMEERESFSQRHPEEDHSGNASVVLPRLRAMTVEEPIIVSERDGDSLNVEVRNMVSTSEAERLGFAPSKHVCAYHNWKPKGVSWGCTCSPAPAHQVNWEKAVFDCGERGVDCPARVQPGVTRDRGLIGRADRGHVAIFCKTSAERALSVWRSARKGMTGRFLRVCDVVRSR